MTTVIVLRGIPGSGKSTWAKAYQASHPVGSVARINNDELVATIYGATWQVQSDIADTLRNVRESLLKVYLMSPDIDTIIVDNTNLSVKTVSGLQKITLRYDADFVVNDEFLSTPYELCVERDAAREKPVGEKVISNFYALAQKLKPWKGISYEIPIVQKYENSPALPTCYIFDIDGTLALNLSGRSIHDESLVGNDSYNFPVWRILLSLYQQLDIERGDRIVFMSGRHETCRVETTEWLKKYWLSSDHDIMLYMRPAGDNRPDYIIKYELFQKYLAGRFYIAGAFDDRDQIVNLWRNQLVLPTFQVANGDF